MNITLFSNKPILSTNIVSIGIISIVCLHIAITYTFSFSIEDDVPRYFRYVTLLMIFSAIWVFMREIVLPKKKFMNPVLYSYLLWFGWCFLTLYINDVHGDARSGFNSLQKISIIALCYYFIIDNNKYFIVLLSGYTVAFFLFALFNYNAISDLGADAGYERFAGSAANPNNLAYMVLVSGWCTIALFFLTSGKYIRSALTFNGFIIYLLALYSGSRKGLLGLPLMLGLVYFFIIRNMKLSPTQRGIISGGVVVIFVLVMVGIFSTEFGTRITDMDLQNPYTSAGERYEMFFVGWRIIKERPIIGIGYDQFRIIGSQYGARFEVPSHATVIDVFACLGVIGGLLYYGFIYLVYRQTQYFLFGEANVADYPDDSAQVLSGLLKILFIIVVFVSITGVVHDSKIFMPLLFAIAGWTKSGRSYNIENTMAK